MLCWRAGQRRAAVRGMALPSPLLPVGSGTRHCRVLPPARQEVPNPAWRGSVPTSTPKKRWRRGADLGTEGVNRIRLLKKGQISSFSAQGIRAETRRDFFFFIYCIS